jgi:hypothetical protein
MVGTKLTELKVEISKYIGIPYFINLPPVKDQSENVLVGKGTAKEIALKTVEYANKENIKLINFTSRQIYNFQKKHHLGIDCSGLAVNLLNFYFGTSLNARRTSANILTSPPLSIPVSISAIQTGDLIRQKDGHHLLFITEKINHTIFYVDSSRHGRGVHYGEIDIIKDHDKFSQGIFRINQ